MKILLISGHGAGDVGACGNGYQEYALTRELVNIITQKLRAYATVGIYDQSRNAFYDVQNGMFSIGDYDYALEVHFNAFNGAAYGTEIYVTDREAGVTVEQEIINNMGEFFTVRGGGVKVTNFLVIDTIKSYGISSALIETCFIDNANDMNIYQANKDGVAAAIVNGIVTGFGLGETEKPEVVTPPEAPNPVPQPEGQEGPQTPSTEKYAVGTPVCTNTLAVASTGGAVYKGDWQGIITKVIPGTPYPYLLNNGTGWTNDAGIDSDPHVPGGSTAAPSITVGSSVIVTNPVDYNGVHLGVSGTYTVMELNGTRAVIGRGGQVTCAIHIDNLALA